MGLFAKLRRCDHTRFFRVSPFKVMLDACNKTGLVAANLAGAQHVKGSKHLCFVRSSPSNLAESSKKVRGAREGLFPEIAALEPLRACSSSAGYRLDPCP